ncbi:MAG: hypothetical protein PVI30_20505 [Myxococcales bacterium]|jgi:cytochrome c553
MRKVLIGIFAASTLAGASCSSEPQEPASSPSTSGDEAGGQPSGESAEAEPKETVSQKMWHHFWDVVNARDAVIGARLSAVKKPLQRVADGDYGDTEMPPDWKHWVEDMQQKAAEGAQAQTLADAAKAVSQLAGACADCHRTTGGGPELEGDTEGYHPAGEGLTEAMHRHVWAAEELWLGLTEPRHEAWVRGAQALAEMPLPQDEPEAAEVEAQAGTTEAEADAQAEAAPAADEPKSPLWAELEKMRALGKRAVDAAQPSDKVAIYADMLTQCGVCHAAAGFE